MLNAKIYVVLLQELIKKVHANGVINSGLIVFKDKRMSVDAIGIEDKKSGVADGTITINVDYPVLEMIEPGEATIGDFSDFLSSLDLFKREDIVSITVQGSQIVVERETPKQVLKYDLTDKKFLKSIQEGAAATFKDGIPVLTFGEKKKTISFAASVRVEAANLVEYGKSLSKISPKFLPVHIKDRKFFTSAKGETKSLLREIDGIIEISGEASSKYDDEFLKIIHHASGVATLSFSDNKPIYIRYEQKVSETEFAYANYLIQASEEE